MSVLVKGFKIPIADEPKTFLTLFNDDGTAEMVALGYHQKRYSIVEVPPHGDLIEQYTAVEVAMEWCPDDDGSVGKIGDLRDLLDEIEALPIIIKAEE